jgi:hypothetical protein
VVGRHFFFGVGVRAAAQGPHNHRAKPSGRLLLINLRVDAERLEQYAAMLQAENIDYRHALRYYDARIPQVMRVVKADNTYTPGGESALMSSIYFFDQDGINREFNAWLPTRAD